MAESEVGAPVQKPRAFCCAQYHMKPFEFAVYHAAIRLTSGGKNRLYATDERFAKEANVSEKALRTHKKHLRIKGWFIVRRSNREKGRAGQFRPTEYKVVEHGEWAASHRGNCRSIPADRLPSEGQRYTEDRYPSQGTDRYPREVQQTISSSSNGCLLRRKSTTGREAQCSTKAQV